MSVVSQASVRADRLKAGRNGGGRADDAEPQRRQAALPGEDSFALKKRGS